MAMNIDFTGKKVLVTGGGRGLGKEMALQFAGCGANVYIANRKEDQGLATVKSIFIAITKIPFPDICSV